MKRLALLLGFVLFVGFVYFAFNKNLKQTDFSAQVAGATTERADEFISAINSYRVERGLNELSNSDDLESIAEIRTADMLNRQYYSHTSPDGLTYNAYFQGYKGYSCENLNLLESSNIDDTISSWINSESHRKCLLSDRLAYAGYSIVKMDDTRYLTALILSEQ